MSRAPSSLSSVAPTQVVDPDATARLASARWIFVFIAIEILCQLALLVGELGPARVLFRSVAFGTSFVMLLAIPGRPQGHHPARIAVLVVIAIITLSMLNPMGSTPTAVVAHWCFYLSVIAPIFWVARLNVSSKTIMQVLVIIWLFSAVSALFGVLQATFPGRFQPSISTLIAKDRIMGIRLVSGAWVPRPMGLTDVPGGAASSGLYAALLGLGVTFARPFRFAREFGIVSMILGMICIYLCQIRAAVVMLAICCTVLLALFALSGRVSRSAAAAVVFGIIAMVGFYVAYELAGDTVTARLATLVADDPATVYRRNRGHFVENAMSELLPKYPLGAGLGRWGMMSQYFGTPESAIWAEVQWVGWILDGGIFLVVAYPLAVLVTLWVAVRSALDSRLGNEGIWAAVVAAYGVGTLALAFSYPVFMSTGGVDFWLINAVLFSALAVKRRTLRAGAPQPS